MMKKAIITIAIAGFTFGAIAQQNPQYSLFMFNKQTINPAYVGSKGSISASADYRTQWTGFGDGAPETFNVALNAPIGKGATIPRHAGGVLFYNDQVGVNTTNGLSLQYAYRISLTEKTLLSFGLEGSLNFFSRDLNKLRAKDSGDETINGGTDSETQPNFGFGLYMFNERYYAGLSIPSLLKSDAFDEKAGELNREPHIFAMGGVLLPATEDFKIRLNGLLKYVNVDGFSDANSPISFDLNVSGIFKDRYLLGVSYRTDETITLLAQIQATKNLNIGYAFDFKSGEYGRPGGVSHEFFLGFDLGAITAPFTTPRFVSYF